MTTPLVSLKPRGSNCGGVADPPAFSDAHSGVLGYADGMADSRETGRCQDADARRLQVCLKVGIATTTKFHDTDGPTRLKSSERSCETTKRSEGTPGHRPAYVWCATALRLSLVTRNRTKQVTRLCRPLPGYFTGGLLVTTSEQVRSIGVRDGAGA